MLFSNLFPCARQSAIIRPAISYTQPILLNVRHRSQLAPKRTKYRKSHKGRIPVRIGGSTKGTTVEQGDFGIRVLEGTKLSAKQLTTAEDAVKKALKPVKGSRVFMRVFPDIPVCVKGNEVRMGKGKGTFEYWACRVPQGKVVLEVGGGGLRQEIASQVLKLAAAKMPVKCEIINRQNLGRVGELDTPRALVLQAGQDLVPGIIADAAKDEQPKL